MKVEGNQPKESDTCFTFAPKMYAITMINKEENFTQLTNVNRTKA